MDQAEENQPAMDGQRRFVMDRGPWTVEENGSKVEVDAGLVASAKAVGYGSRTGGGLNARTAFHTW